MFIAALFTAVKRRTQPKWPLGDEWINKVLYAHVIDYYSGLKKGMKY